MVAGRLADQLGRTAITSGAMIISGGCCLVSPLAFAAATRIVVVVLLVWGASVFADSGQFSAASTELAEPRYAGSVPALQLALGFASVVVSGRWGTARPHLVPTSGAGELGVRACVDSGPRLESARADRL